MNREPASFELCMPGIVTGLMLATLMLEPGDEEPQQNIPSNDSKKKHCFSSGGTDAL